VPSAYVLIVCELGYEDILIIRKRNKMVVIRVQHWAMVKAKSMV